MKCCLLFIPPLMNCFMISGLLKSALEETILNNVLCLQLVKHTSVSLQHLDIAGKHMPTHLLQYKLGKKIWISSLDKVHQKLSTHSSFCAVSSSQPHSLPEWCRKVSKANQHVWLHECNDLIWAHAGLKCSYLRFSVRHTHRPTLNNEFPPE